MHAVFMIYGIEREVEFFKMQLRSQKFKLRMWKSGEKEEKMVWVQGRLCLAPFGVFEYAFPKEYMNEVLTSLGFQNADGAIKTEHKIKNRYIGLLRKALRCEKTPKFPTDKAMIWFREHITILPIGIREDKEMTEPSTSGEYAGWTHEGI